MLRKLAFFLMLIFPLSSFSASESFTIDPNHSYPNFKINHLGFSTMHGRFGKTTGKLNIDRLAKTGSVDVVIDASSINTGMKKRDDHLRSPDFLNAAEFPDITYKSDKVTLHDDGSGRVDGRLTIMGVSKAVSLAITSMHCGIHPFDPAKKKYVCGFNASALIKRSEFGVTYGAPGIGDEMELEIEIEAIRD